MIIPISADFTKLIEYSDSSTDTWSFGGGTTTTTTYQGLMLHFENIENYADISEIYIQPDENINYYASGYTGTAVFPCRLRDSSNATRIYSYGTLTILNNGGGSESVSVDLSAWNNYGKTGVIEIPLHCGYLPSHGKQGEQTSQQNRSENRAPSHTINQKTS